ncbi:hypothetical protein IWZ00DRAFT_345333 [Phyllosticta capitalensis]|uniref:Uncharacterized protein n=1 Tax=Phyllosticta capitalensis TaxID=121624 RepID=A0ABR1Y962_9PEZI
MRKKPRAAPGARVRWMLPSLGHFGCGGTHEGQGYLHVLLAERVGTRLFQENESAEFSFRLDASAQTRRHDPTASSKEQQEKSIFLLRSKPTHGNSNLLGSLPLTDSPFSWGRRVRLALPALPARDVREPPSQTATPKSEIPRPEPSGPR